MPGRVLFGRQEREQLGEPDGVEHPEHRHDAEREAEVAHAVDHEGLDRRGIGAGLLEPEADQPVGGDAHPFPAEEQLHEVGRRHQRQHGEGEERQIGEEAGLGVVVLHVAPAVDVHERRDGGHHHQHHRRQAVDADRPVGLEVVDLDERHDVGDEARPAAPDLAAEHRPAHGAGDEQDARRDGHGGLVADAAAEQPRDGRPDQGQKHKRNDKGLVVHALNPSSSRRRPRRCRRGCGRR